MKARKVQILPSVEKQIIEQVLFIAADSIDNALRWEARLRVAIKRLGELPKNAIDEDASERVGEPICKLVFERTYLVRYRVIDSHNVIEIVSFEHGARTSGRGGI